MIKDFENTIENECIIDVHRVSTDDFKLREDPVAAVSQGVENPGRQFRGKAHVILTENDIGQLQTSIFCRQRFFLE